MFKLVLKTWERQLAAAAVGGQGVLVYAGPDAEHLRCAGRLSLTPAEADELREVVQLGARILGARVEVAVE